MTNVFQSTHPHRVRHLLLGFFASEYGVSIHAPTQGATLIIETGHAFFFVSIHAPTQGATLVMLQVVFGLLFQSTHPHRVRLCK